MNQLRGDATFEDAVTTCLLACLATCTKKIVTFYSVTLTIDKVIVHSNAPYRYGWMLHSIYIQQEAQEDAPSMEELASIVEGAFESEGFTYYLWGRSIWNSISACESRTQFQINATSSEH
jgi:hypothetical protein